MCLWRVPENTGTLTDLCNFCQVEVGNRRPPPVSPTNTLFTPRSRRAQPRPRITPPSSPTPLNPPARPRRIRTRPRHFDSSPDLDLPRRCEKAIHVPAKAARDFIDARGIMRPICNDCRQDIRQRRRSLTVSTDSSTDSESLSFTQNRQRIDSQQPRPPTTERIGQRRRSSTISADLSIESERRPLPTRNRQQSIGDIPLEVILR